MIVASLGNRDCGNLPDDKRNELLDWVRSLNVRPEDVRPELTIEQDGRNYRLHLTRIVRDAAGKAQLDPLEPNAIAKEPLTVDLGSKPTWPDWLNHPLMHPDRALLARLDDAVGRITGQ
ncbi:MAG TPA: hypothetical protein VIP77_15905 [Jiangellaceae bacterium]